MRPVLAFVSGSSLLGFDLIDLAQPFDLVDRPTCARGVEEPITAAYQGRRTVRAACRDAEVHGRS